MTTWSSFTNDKTIISAEFGNDCTVIPSSAFKDCTNLTEINNTNVIKTIEDNAFNNTGLTKVSFNEVTCIGSGAFQNCTNLTNIDIPECTTIGSSAFQVCTNLTNIDIPKCTTIGSSAFQNCTNLTNINIPKCTTIGSSAFQYCTNLTNINIPKCTTIGSSAFQNCTNLTEINNGNVIETIGDNAFNNTGLTTISFNKVTSIGSSAFNNCTSLTNIDIPKCTTIGSSAFNSCTSLTKLNLKKCNQINNGAFYGCNNLRQVTLTCCSFIGRHAFSKCESLSKVYIKNSNIFCVLEDKYVFCDHTSDSDQKNHNITFYINPLFIGLYKNNENWKHYEDNMQVAPYDYSILYESSYPESDEQADNKLKITGYYENYVKDHSYNNIGIIDFSEKKLETLEYPLFTEDTNTYLTYIHLSNTFKEIGDKVFAGCENLKDIILSEDLTSIGKYAFENCKSLTTIEIPESVEMLDEGAFAGCEKLEKFEGKFATYNGRALVNGICLISVVPIDNSNTEGRIHKISEIDTAISYLGKSCFQGCKNMIRVDISPDVIEIGDYAFKDCKKLREIHFEGPNPPKIGENIFENINSDFKIFVPEDKFNEYCKKFEKIKNIHNHIYPKPNDNSIIYYGTITSEISQTVTNSKYTNGNYSKISNIGTTLPTDYFKEQKGLKKVILGEGITKLSKNAFENCINLEYIYLSDDILELNNRCFSGCTNLTRIHIPYGSYTQLTNIIPPLTNTKNVIGDFIKPQKPITNYIYMLTSFGDEIFYGCSNLKEFGTYHKGCVSDDNKCYIQNSKLMFFAGYIDGETVDYNIPPNIVITSINKSAFKGTKKIKTIKLVESITTIGESAFEECTELEYIYNWNFVETISKKAFYKCTNIGKNIDEELSLPVKLTTIGESAFEGCVNLKKVSIPEESILEEICEMSFYGCTALTSINLPQSLKSIGMSAFAGCEKLTTVTIPEDSILEEICEMSFYGCTALTSINLPQSLKSIGMSAFAGCEKLTTVSIPEDSILEEICEKSFYECINLIEINLPQSLKSIGMSAFAGCEKLTTVSIPEDSILEEICEKSFYECAALTSINLPQSLKSIGMSAFENCINLIEINLPQSLKSIGMSAFEGCVGLSKIDINKNIKKINIKTFYNCEKLTTVTIPEDSLLEEICEKSFYECINLIEINLPQSLKSIGESAFKGCEKMYINNIPETVTYIGQEAFSECKSLKCVDNDEKEITLKLNITNIYNKTFYNCQSLTSVNIINSDIDKIYDSAFEGCVNLRTVSLPENSSLSKIGNSSFLNCKSLEYIYIPDTLTHIGMSAFENCTSYKGSHIDTKESIYLILNNISNLGDFCFKNSGINNLRIEDTSNILEIPISAFENCEQLEKVVISKNITTLKEKSFNGCKNLSSYNSSDVLNCINLLDSNVEVIEDKAFGDCDILNIYLNKSLKTLGNLCLLNTKSNKLTKIYINKNVNTPPKFSNEGAYPFGKPIVGRFIRLPKIYVDNLLQKTLYQEDNDWCKYDSCFITKNDIIIPTFPPILDWKPIDIPNKDGGTAIDPTTGRSTN